MMNSQVRQLDLKLSLPQSLQSDSWQIAQDLRRGFVCQVVEVIEDRLNAKYGSDAIVEIPNLCVSWKGDREAFTDYDYARQLGEDIVCDVVANAELQTVGTASERYSNSEIRVFRNTVHRSTVKIVALSQEQARATTIANAEQIEVEWRQVAEQGADGLLECAQYIADYSDPDEVLTAISKPLLEMLTGMLPAPRWPSRLRKFIFRRLNEAGVKTSPTGRADETVPQSAIAETTTVNSQGPPPGQVLDESPGNTTERNVAGDSPNQALQGFESPETRAAVQGVHAQRDAVADAPVSVTKEIQNNVFQTVAEIVEIPETQKTRFAGLVYMLNLIRRIELPDILWCCAIDERSFLFDLFREIVGEEGRDDTIVYAVSGIFPDRSNYMRSLIPAWAWEEVIGKVDRNIRKLVPDIDRQDTSDTYAHAQLDSMQKSVGQDGFWFALVGVMARLVRHAFLARLVSNDSNIALHTYIALKGEIEESDEAIIVRISIDSIDIDVRKEALDANPGYLEWRRKKLLLNFEE